ncbi:MAG: ABC transporter substrate-binding protein [Roseitalea sp.]|nr:ABC transporter substrate-binding protein [Roseitalea sp.]MBO6723748.1 ABC transporter substrate-binding protein [Roseitalea sp.]MBO6744672.1 ABC transporter substrate-binding protein [Roseitalea sp.]
MTTGSAFAVLLAIFTGAPARAAEGAAIIAPLSGSYAPVGRALDASVRAILGDDVPALDDGCDADMAQSAARDVIEAGDALVIGLPCIDAFDAAMPMLADTGVPVIAVGVRAADITMAPRGTAQWPVFRVGPTAGEEATVLAGHLARSWREANFAIIDDGTLYGRQLAENMRLLLAEAALEPVFVDTYRPLLESQTALVRRLQRSGASHVLIGGEARDAAIIAADAARIGYRLTMAGGDSLIAPPADGRLPDGTITVALPPDTDPARIAAQIARTALSATMPTTDALRTMTFQTDIGPLAFGADGEPDARFLRIHTFRNGRPEPLTPDMDG